MSDDAQWFADALAAARVTWDSHLMTETGCTCRAWHPTADDGLDDLLFGQHLTRQIVEAVVSAARPAVAVLGPIPQGGIVALSEVDFADEVGGNEAVVDALHYGAGHDRFTVLFLPSGGKVGVFGPDDLVAALRAVREEG